MNLSSRFLSQRRRGPKGPYIEPSRALRLCERQQNLDEKGERMSVSKETAVALFRDVLLIRIFEERAAELYLSGLLPGFIHSYLWEEAVAAGVCRTLRSDDYVTSTHRGHGHVLAKGASPDRMMAELFGKETGYCRGKGGSMHIADFDLNILGANGIVGAGIPIACGAGLASKMQGTDRVTVCFFGDGATNQGTFHEGMNLAAIWTLPVIFVCENNLYALSTPQEIHQKVTDVYARSASYGMPGVLADGNDALDVYEKALPAVEAARRGEGPTLIECRTYRKLGHYIGEPARYRPTEEVEAWRQRDAVAHMRDHLTTSSTLSETECDAMEADVRAEVERAVEFARNSPDPKPEDALEDVYCGEIGASCL